MGDEHQAAAPRGALAGKHSPICLTLFVSHLSRPRYDAHPPSQQDASPAVARETIDAICAQISRSLPPASSEAPPSGDAAAPLAASLDALGMTLVALASSPPALPPQPQPRTSPARLTPRVPEVAPAPQLLVIQSALDWLHQRLPSLLAAKTIVATSIGTHLFRLIDLLVSWPNTTPHPFRLALLILNWMLAKCPSNKIRYASQPELHHTASLVNLMPRIPDIHAQLSALEFVYRLFPKRMSDRNTFLSKVGFTHIEMLADMSSTDFTRDARVFIASINASNDGINALPLSLELQSVECKPFSNSPGATVWSFQRPQNPIWADIGMISLGIIALASDNDSRNGCPHELDIPFAHMTSFSILGDTEVRLTTHNEAQGTRSVVVLHSAEANKLARILEHRRVPHRQLSKMSIVSMPLKVHVRRPSPVLMTDDDVNAILKTPSRHEPLIHVSDDAQVPIDALVDSNGPSKAEDSPDQPPDTHPEPITLIVDDQEEDHVHLGIQNESEDEWLPDPPPQLPTRKYTKRSPQIPSPKPQQKQRRVNALALAPMFTHTPSPKVVPAGRQNRARAGGAKRGRQVTRRHNQKRVVQEHSSPEIPVELQHQANTPLREVEAIRGETVRNRRVAGKHKTPKKRQPSPRLSPQRILKPKRAKKGDAVDSDVVSTEKKVDLEYGDREKQVDVEAVGKDHEHQMHAPVVPAHIPDATYTHVVDEMGFEAASISDLHSVPEGPDANALGDGHSIVRSEHLDAATHIARTPDATELRHQQPRHKTPLSRSPLDRQAPTNPTSPTNTNTRPTDDIISGLLTQVTQIYKEYIARTLAQVSDRLDHATSDKNYVMAIQRAVEERIEKTHAFGRKIQALRDACETLQTVPQTG